MPDDPQPQPESQTPSRRRFFARKWHWKDVTLFVMGLLLLAVSGYAFREPLMAAVAKLKAGAKGGRRWRCSTCSSTARTGSMSTSCSTSRWGRGRWTRSSIRLRRRSSRRSAGPGSGRTPTRCGSSRAAASRWRASTRSRSIPDRLLQAGAGLRRRHRGHGAHGPVPGRGGTSPRSRRWRGRPRSSSAARSEFNYPVNPETLAPKIHLVDPGAVPKPIEVKLETD